MAGLKRRQFLAQLGAHSALLPAAYVLSGVGSLQAAEPERPASPARGRGGITRDFFDRYLEVLRLLKEVAEVEHALMIQYLYASYSLKPQYEALAGHARPGSNSFLGVAIEEMHHLSIVNRLLVELGGQPHLGRQDFPAEPDIYPFHFDLEPLSRISAAKYTYVEAPVSAFSQVSDPTLIRGLHDTLGRLPRMNHVGSVYQILIDHVKALAEEDPTLLADPDEWIRQLEHVMEEGEDGHFNFFRQVFLGEHPAFGDHPDIWALEPTHRDFPSRPMPVNPTAYQGHPDEIGDADQRGLAWLSNLHYWSVLMLLDDYYRYGDSESVALARVHMMGPLHTIACQLANDNVGVPFDVLSMGYSPSTNRAGALRILGHLCGEAEGLAQRLAPLLPGGYPHGIHQQTAQTLVALQQRHGDHAAVA